MLNKCRIKSVAVIYKITATQEMCVWLRWKSTRHAIKFYLLQINRKLT